MRKITLLGTLLLLALGGATKVEAENRLLNDADGLPGTITTLAGGGHQQYEWTSPEITAPAGMKTIRLTFLENQNKAHDAGYPYVAIAEFYLYDKSGNKVNLNGLSIFSSNATETSEGGLDKLNDGVLTGNVNNKYDWYWHSYWSHNVGAYHYLEINVADLGADLEKFKVGYVTRQEAGAPSEMVLTTGTSTADVNSQLSQNVTLNLKNGTEQITSVQGSLLIGSPYANLTNQWSNLFSANITYEGLPSANVEYEALAESVYNLQCREGELPFKPGGHFTLSIRSNTKWLRAEDDGSMSFSRIPCTLDNYLDYDKYQWTVEGDGIHGFYIKHVKSGKYITSPDANPADDARLYLADAPSELSKFHIVSAAANYRFRLVGTDHAYFSDIYGAGHTAIWADEGTYSDGGSQFMAHTTSSVNDLLEEWKSNIIVNLGYVGGYDQNVVTLEEVQNVTFDTYQAFETKYAQDIVTLEDSKYYVIESAYPGFTDGKRRVITADDAGKFTWREYAPNNVNAIWKIEAATEGKYTIQAVNSKKYAGLSDFMQPFQYSDTPQEYTISATSNGTITVAKSIQTHNESGTLYTMAVNSNAQPSSTATSGDVCSYNDRSSGHATAWLIREATELEVALNSADGASYATTYLPFAASVKNDATAYTGTLNADKTALNATAVEGAFPAETGIILKSDEAATKAVLTIGGEVAANFDKGVLSGTLTGKTHESGELTFGRNADNQVGFFAYNGSDLAANKAYLTLPSGVKGLVLDFGGNEVTGLTTVETNGENAAAVYDLSGRRVQQVHKGGLYIVGGKKMLAK